MNVRRLAFCDISNPFPQTHKSRIKFHNFLRV